MAAGNFCRNLCATLVCSEHTHIFYAQFGQKALKKWRLICFIRKDVGCEKFPSLSADACLTYIKINKITLNYGRSEKGRKFYFFYIESGNGS